MDREVEMVPLTEAEIYLGRSAKTARQFDRRVLSFRIAFVAAIGLLLPSIIGPHWVVPVTLLVVVSASTTQLGRRAIISLPRPRCRSSVFPPRWIVVGGGLE